MQRKHSLIALILLGAIGTAIAFFYLGERTGALAEGGATTTPGKSATAVAGKGKDAAALATASKAVRATRGPLTSAVSNASAKGPLPAPGAPLKQTLAELKALADEGDAAASSRLYHDLQACNAVQRINQNMSNMSGRLFNQNASQMSPAAAQGSDRMLNTMQNNLDFAQNNAAMCAGLTSDDLANLVPATLQAAQQGDPDAADCYVGANLNSWPGLVSNPSWISDYQSNALPLANAAVQQGNWAMVGLMASAYNGGGRNMLSQVTGLNAAQAYSYAKLMSLGQPADSNSTRASNNLSNLASQLTPEQQQAADAWAQNEYQQNFASTPRQPGETANTMRSCQNGGQ